MVIGFSVSLGPIPWLYFAEILEPNEVRICGAFLWFGTFITGILFPILVAFFGMVLAFFSFLIISLLMTIYLFINLVETKGLTQPEIFEAFQ